MSDNFRKRKRTKEELRKIAQHLREWLGIKNDNVVDIVAILRLGRTIPTVDGKKKIAVEIVPDSELGRREAETRCLEDKILMRVRSSLWNAATRVPEDEDELRSHRRAKFTLTHELFHGVLGHGGGDVALARHEDSRVDQKGRYISQITIAEYEANFSAANFLAPLDRIDEGADVSWIQATFDFNYKAAQQRLEEFGSEKRNPNIVDGLNKLAETLRALRPAERKPTISKAEDLAADVANSNREVSAEDLRLVGCTRCGFGGARAVGGNRFACTFCGIVGEIYQDGDPLIDS